MFWCLMQTLGWLLYFLQKADKYICAAFPRLSSPFSLPALSLSRFPCSLDRNQMKEDEMKEALMKGWGDGRITEWVTAFTAEKSGYAWLWGQIDGTVLVYVWLRVCYFDACVPQQQFSRSLYHCVCVSVCVFVCVCVCVCFERCICLKSLALLC